MNNDTFIFHYSSGFKIFHKKRKAPCSWCTHILHSSPHLCRLVLEDMKKNYPSIIVSLHNPNSDRVDCYWVFFHLSFFSLLLIAIAKVSRLRFRELFCRDIMRNNFPFVYSFIEKRSQTLPVTIRVENLAKRRRRRHEVSATGSRLEHPSEEAVSYLLRTV